MLQNTILVDGHSRPSANIRPTYMEGLDIEQLWEQLQKEQRPREEEQRQREAAESRALQEQQREEEQGRRNSVRAHRNP